VALPGKKIEELSFQPLSGGSGMIGLPGDFTPPSRFIRHVDLKKIDFVTPKELSRAPLDKDKKQDIEDVTPGK
jgi:penicillin V acylase-like amidase (Ntn superfamily)